MPFAFHHLSIGEEIFLLSFLCCWNSFEQRLPVVSFSREKITVCIGLFGFRPFVDHISVIMLFHFRWSSQIKKKHIHTPSDQRQNRRVREWAAAVIVIVYFVVCFIFSAWSLRYPAESNNATGFFYMIIICSVINTLTPERIKWKKEWNK